VIRLGLSGFRRAASFEPGGRVITAAGEALALRSGLVVAMGSPLIGVRSRAAWEAVGSYGINQNYSRAIATWGAIAVRVGTPVFSAPCTIKCRRCSRRCVLAD